MGLEITPASEADYTIVGNLARFYIYDIAEHAGLNFPADGLFDSEGQLANYWGKTGGKHVWPSAWRGFPFLLRMDGHPAGFALVKRTSDTPATFDMGEFFIARQYRRRGFGHSVATALFDRFAGAWEVREMPVNAPAQAFWRRSSRTIRPALLPRRAKPLPPMTTRSSSCSGFCRERQGPPDWRDKRSRWPLLVGGGQFLQTLTSHIRTA